MTTPEVASVPAILLRSKAVDWTIGDQKSKYGDFVDVHQFNAMFSEGFNTIIYDWRGVKCDTNIGEWNRRRNSMNSCCSWYLHVIGFYKHLVRHVDEK